MGQLTPVAVTARAAPELAGTHSREKPGSVVQFGVLFPLLGFPAFHTSPSLPLWPWQLRFRSGSGHRAREGQTAGAASRSAPAQPKAQQDGNHGLPPAQTTCCRATTAPEVADVPPKSSSAP